MYFDQFCFILCYCYLDIDDRLLIA